MPALAEAPTQQQQDTLPQAPVIQPTEPTPAPNIVDGISMEELAQLANVTFEAAAVKKDLANDNGTAHSMELTEHSARELARKRQQETPEERQGRFNIRRTVSRIWKQSIFSVADYGRKKSDAMEQIAESGIHVESLPHTFLQELNIVALQTVESNRTTRGQRIRGNVDDFLSAAFFAQNELTREQTVMLRYLRAAALMTTEERVALARDGVTPPAGREGLRQFLRGEDGNYTPAELINRRTAVNGLVSEFDRIVTGESRAEEALADRLKRPVVRGVVGERKSANAIAIDGSFKELLANDIIDPFLHEVIGVAPGSEAFEKARLKAEINARNAFLSPEGVDWRNRHQVTDSAAIDALDTSLSYATNIMKEVSKAAEHVKSAAAIEKYKELLVLKANLGTLRAGPQTTIKESFSEGLTTRKVSGSSVRRYFADRRTMSAGRTEVDRRADVLAITPNAVLEAATVRSNILRRLSGDASGSAFVDALRPLAAVGVGVGIYAAQKSGSLVMPILGGSIVKGITTGIREYQQTKREQEVKNREEVQGYHTDGNSPRRERLATMPIVNLETDVFDPLNNFVTETNAVLTATGPGPHVLTREQLFAGLAYLSDFDARKAIENQQQDVDLFRVSLGQVREVEKNRAQEAYDRATEALGRYFERAGANPDIATQFSELDIRFGTVTGPEDYINQLRATQEVHLLRGQEVGERFYDILEAVQLGGDDLGEQRENSLAGQQLAADQEARQRAFIKGTVGGVAAGLGAWGTKVGADWLADHAHAAYVAIDHILHPAEHVAVSGPTVTETVEAVQGVRVQVGNITIDNLPTGWDNVRPDGHDSFYVDINGVSYHFTDQIAPDQSHQLIDETHTYIIHADTHTVPVGDAMQQEYLANADLIHPIAENPPMTAHGVYDQYDGANYAGYSNAGHWNDGPVLDHDGNQIAWQKVPGGTLFGRNVNSGLIPPHTLGVKDPNPQSWFNDQSKWLHDTINDRILANSGIDQIRQNQIVQIADLPNGQHLLGIPDQMGIVHWQPGTMQPGTVFHYGYYSTSEDPNVAKFVDVAHGANPQGMHFQELASKVLSKDEIPNPQDSTTVINVRFDEIITHTHENTNVLDPKVAPDNFHANVPGVPFEGSRKPLETPLESAIPLSDNPEEDEERELLDGEEAFNDKYDEFEDHLIDILGGKGAVSFEDNVPLISTIAEDDVERDDDTVIKWPRRLAPAFIEFKKAADNVDPDDADDPYVSLTKNMGELWDIIDDNPALREVLRNDQHYQEYLRAENRILEQVGPEMNPDSPEDQADLQILRNFLRAGEYVEAKRALDAFHAEAETHNIENPEMRNISNSERAFNEAYQRFTAQVDTLNQAHNASAIINRNLSLLETMNIVESPTTVIQWPTELTSLYEALNATDDRSEERYLNIVDSLRPLRDIFSSVNPDLVAIAINNPNYQAYIDFRRQLLASDIVANLSNTESATLETFLNIGVMMEAKRALDAFHLQQQSAGNSGRRPGDAPRGRNPGGGDILEQTVPLADPEHRRIATEFETAYQDLVKLVDKASNPDVPTIFNTIYRYINDDLLESDDILHEKYMASNMNIVYNLIRKNMPIGRPLDHDYATFLLTVDRVKNIVDTNPNFFGSQNPYYRRYNGFIEQNRNRYSGQEELPVVQVMLDITQILGAHEAILTQQFFEKNPPEKKSNLEVAVREFEGRYAILAQIVAGSSSENVKTVWERVQSDVENGMFVNENIDILGPNVLDDVFELTLNDRDTPFIDFQREAENVFAILPGHTELLTLLESNPDFVPYVRFIVENRERYPDPDNSPRDAAVHRILNLVAIIAAHKVLHTRSAQPVPVPPRGTGTPPPVIDLPRGTVGNPPIPGSPKGTPVASGGSVEAVLPINLVSATVHERVSNLDNEAVKKNLIERGYPNEVLASDEKHEYAVAVSSIPDVRHPDRNEDTPYFDGENGIIIVADGFGDETHGNGDVASKTAVQNLYPAFLSLPQNITRGEMRIEMKAIWEKANQSLIEKGKEIGNNKMGTTITAIKVFNENGRKIAAVLHAGDSRAYVVRGGRPTQITIDDAFYQKLQDPERLKDLLDNAIEAPVFEEDMQGNIAFAQRNVVTSGMYAEKTTEPSIEFIDVTDAEFLFVESDGDHDNLTRLEMEAIVSHANSAQELSSMMSHAARLRSKETTHGRSKADDMTTVALQLKKAKPTPPPSGSSGGGSNEDLDMDGPAEETSMEELPVDTDIQTHTTIISPREVKIPTQTRSVMPKEPGTLVGSKELGFVQMYELNLSDIERARLKQNIRFSSTASPVIERGSPGEFRLSVAALENADLLPKYEIKLNGTLLLFSKPYIFEGRTAFVGYVNDGSTDQFTARTYYLSNSQESWRYLPAYREGWFEKGFSEESINTPIPVQLALFNLVAQQGAAKVDHSNRYFFGTANHLDINVHNTYRVVMGNPANFEGNVFPPEKYDRSGNRKKLAPESIQVANEQAPDFNKKIEQAKINYMNARGENVDVIFDIYPSKDGTLRYMFRRTKDNKAGIAMIEKKSDVNIVGLRGEWVDPGDLTTPIYEYTSQDGGYGDYSDRDGNYVDMFNNYLSNIPIIKEYLRAESILASEKIDSRPTPSEDKNLPDVGNADQLTMAINISRDNPALTEDELAERLESDSSLSVSHEVARNIAHLIKTPARGSKNRLIEEEEKSGERTSLDPNDLWIG